jgi:hypothetical protein
VIGTPLRERRIEVVMPDLAPRANEILDDLDFHGNSVTRGSAYLS